MSEPLLERPAFAPKWYLNGFPKSGLHMLEQMVQPLAQPEMEPDSPFGKPWDGTHIGNSWSGQRAELERVLYRAGRLRDQCYLKSHTAYDAEIERFLWYLGTAHVLIYRDLRDVAVSQAHHILNENDERFVHPGKAEFRALGGFNEVLAAVITGLGNYPGVVERWAMYAPWLDVDWVLKVRYEDARANLPTECARVLRYGLSRVAAIWGRQARIDEQMLAMFAEVMATNARQTDRSPTFRKGQVGGWREVFTPRHGQLFREADRAEWVERMGGTW